MSKRSCASPRPASQKTTELTGEVETFPDSAALRRLTRCLWDMSVGSNMYGRAQCIVFELLSAPENGKNKRRSTTRRQTAVGHSQER